MATDYYDRAANAWICRLCDKNTDDCQCHEAPEPDAMVTAVKWVPTTEKHYYDMLGVLPPASYGDGGAFQVGEPMDHKGGRLTFSSFKMEGDDNYFESEEALTFKEFAAEVKNASYCYAG